MKLTKRLMGAVAAGLMAVVANQSQAGAPLTQYPLVKLNISGTITYSDGIVTNNGTVTKSSPLKKKSFNNKTLIDLLNASPTFQSALTNQFGVNSNQAPANSYIVWNIGNGILTLTNKNGFSFALSGFSSLIARDAFLTGTSSLNNSNGAGSETDLTGVFFVFNDQNGNIMECYGTATLKWNYGPVSAGVQKTTLSVSMSGRDFFGEVDFNVGAPSFNASGSGTGMDPAVQAPFYRPVL